MRVWLAILFLVLVAFAVAFADGPAALTEIETLQVRVFQLELALETAEKRANDCQGTLGAYRAELRRGQLTTSEADLKARIEQNHPGFSFDTRTGTLTADPEGK